ncbi:branched-chain amino acid ABC transporter substrate-binding protein [Bacillus taeanensis]|uniref:Branched-chain amino acid ABC transporter substrate-binding protein n=1 Tax=Bacillus taeanensis TaxID=273032 RepID=A0A366XYY1_9BACI|nr:branched-chain amino acid ABC transporter substrate-binding protein [Bacillus taeanensis]RBW71362.1 branched-chain amino acid ABC transporter substrate-binding protein [Bacillus taeanensis]
MSKKLFCILMLVVLVFGVLAGCTSSKSNQPASSDGDSASSSSPTVIKVAAASPLSGSIATLGEAIKLGAQLKLEENKKKFEELGYKLELVPYDDQADPKKGVANAQMIAADTAILGVIGHLNSGVSIPSSETYQKYNIAMISPASTATDFTDRGLAVVNRIVARDDFQGPAGADFAVNELSAKKIFVIQDKTAYGQGLAEAFKSSAEELGAEIVGYEGITVGEKDFNGVLNQVLSKKPDLIYFGGMYSEGGLLVKQAREKNISVPFMGGDGIDSSTMVEIAGDKISNTYYTSVAADVSKIEAGVNFAESYKEKFGKNVESYSAYGYDAMGVMLAGIEKAIEDNNGSLPTREQVSSTVRATQNYEGVVTKVGFDEKGDNKYAKVYIFKFDTPTYPGEQVGEVTK